MCGGVWLMKGLGLSEEDIKKMFAYFDADGSGEIDFSEFRRFLQGGMQQTGLQVGAAVFFIRTWCVVLVAIVAECYYRMTRKTTHHPLGRFP